MKQRVIRSSICVAVFLAVLFGVFYFGPPARHIRQAHQHMRELAAASDLRDVALACVSLLQSDPSSTPLVLGPSDDRLPSAIRSKQPGSVMIDPPARTVIIEFGGGFFHYGYRFEPVPSAATQAHLLIYGEEESDAHELLRL